MTQLSQFPDFGGGSRAPLGSSRHSDDENTNNLAVTSMILGILGCGSAIGVILGIVALRQIRVNGGRGQGAAIAGIVAFPLWLVIGGAVAFAVYLSHLPKPADGVLPRAAASASQGLDIRMVRVGQCINAPTTSSVFSVQVVPCGQAHDGEVLFTRTLELFQPTETEIKRAAQAACTSAALPKIRHDPAADELTVVTYRPTARGYRSGDRSVACVGTYVSDGKKLTRPLKTG